MKKYVFLTTTAIMISLCGSVLAAPMTDYKFGKISVQVGVNTLNDIKSVVKGGTVGAAKSTFEDHEKTKPYAGVTLGIVKNMGLQYRYEQLKSNPDGNGGSVYSKIDSQEYNFRYALDNKISVYIGDYHVKFKGSENNGDGFGSKSRDLPHVGLTGVLPLSGNLCAWGDVGAGKDIYHYELGLGYKLMKNLCLDLSYKYLRVDEMGDYVVDYVTKAKLDGKTRGVRLGVTLSF